MRSQPEQYIWRKKVLKVCKGEKRFKYLTFQKQKNKDKRGWSPNNYRESETQNLPKVRQAQTKDKIGLNMIINVSFNFSN